MIVKNWMRVVAGFDVVAVVRMYFVIDNIECGQVELASNSG